MSLAFLLRYTHADDNDGDDNDDDDDYDYNNEKELQSDKADGRWSRDQHGRWR